MLLSWSELCYNSNWYNTVSKSSLSATLFKNMHLVAVLEEILGQSYNMDNTEHIGSLCDG